MGNRHLTICPHQHAMGSSEHCLSELLRYLSISETDLAASGTATATLGTLIARSVHIVATRAADVRESLGQRCVDKALDAALGYSNEHQLDDDHHEQQRSKRQAPQWNWELIDDHKRAHENREHPD